MANDPISFSLAALNRFAGSKRVQRWGISKPAQKMLYWSTRGGFRAASTVARQFKAARKLAGATRLQTVKKPDLFDLSLDENQEMLRQMARRFAKEVMRDAANGADAISDVPEGFHEQIGELGLNQFAIPEALGGIAEHRSVVTQALVAEDLAYGDMGMAVAAMAPLAVANAMCKWGSAQQQSKYLPAFAGEKPPLAALAIAERSPAFEPNRLKTRAILNAEGYVLNGEKTLVPLAEKAEVYLVSADLLGKGPQVFIVEAGTKGPDITVEHSMGIRAASLGSISFDNLLLPHEALLGEQADVVDYGELIDLSHIAWSAMSVGTSQAVLDYVIAYCNDRSAFGEPISHRQSVAFMIADIAIELESMRLLTWRAAARAEQGLDFHRQAYQAKILCAEKSMQIATDGVQLLGGHGYIKDHPVERWYRDLMAIGVAEGGLLV